jgi:hypothetical protein
MGKAKIEILFLSITVSFDVTWGESDQPTLDAVDPWEPLLEALNRPESWGAMLPPGQTMVEALRSLEPTGEEPTEVAILVHPASALEVRQSVLPFGICLKQFGNAPVKDHDSFGIESLRAGSGQDLVNLETEPVDEFFSRGQFDNLSDAQRLSLPSYEKMQGGVASRADALLVGGSPQQFELAYKSILIDEKQLSQQPRDAEGAVRFGMVGWQIADRLTRGSVPRRNGASASGLGRFGIRGQEPKVALAEESYAIVNRSDLQLTSGITPNNGSMNRMQADQVLETYCLDHPDEGESLQVVPSFEVAS